MSTHQAPSKVSPPASTATESASRAIAVTGVESRISALERRASSSARRRLPPRIRNASIPESDVPS